MEPYTLAISMFLICRWSKILGLIQTPVPHVDCEVCTARWFNRHMLQNDWQSVNNNVKLWMSKYTSLSCIHFSRSSFALFMVRLQWFACVSISRQSLSSHSSLRPATSRDWVSSVNYTPSCSSCSAWKRCRKQYHCRPVETKLPLRFAGAAWLRPKSTISWKHRLRLILGSCYLKTLFVIISKVPTEVWGRLKCTDKICPSSFRQMINLLPKRGRSHRTHARQSLKKKT